MSGYHIVLVSDKKGAPVWQFRTGEVTPEEIITEPIMSGSIRAGPGMSLEVDGKPAGTIVSARRLGPTGKFRIVVKPPAAKKAKPAAKSPSPGAKTPRFTRPESEG